MIDGRVVRADEPPRKCPPGRPVPDGRIFELSVAVGHRSAPDWLNDKIAIRAGFAPIMVTACLYPFLASPVSRHRKGHALAFGIHYELRALPSLALGRSRLVLHNCRRDADGVGRRST